MIELKEEGTELHIPFYNGELSFECTTYAHGGSAVDIFYNNRHVLNLIETEQGLFKTFFLEEEEEGVKYDLYSWGENGEKVLEGVVLFEEVGISFLSMFYGVFQIDALGVTNVGERTRVNF